MVEFIINQFIKLKLENGKTNIYVNDKLFNQCKYVMIKKRINEITNLNNIESVDELIFENLDQLLEEYNPEVLGINERIEFWVHCSNLQVWAENDYNTRMLHSDLAFPLLKKLYKLGDSKAQKVFKEEIAKRIESQKF